MMIDDIEELEFRDNDFRYRKKLYAYKKIVSIYFKATITQLQYSGIPAGKTYSAKLHLKLNDRSTLEIQPRKGFLGKMKKAGMEALQYANAILSEMSFNFRIAGYEQQVSKNGFFEYGAYQFHKSGYLYKNGKEIYKLTNHDISISLIPFAMIISVKKKSLGARLASMLLEKDEVIDISTDYDCIIYMMNSLYQVSWDDTPIRQKRVDRQELFYVTVLRFGAMLAIADGSADPDELAQLKNFFQIDKDKIANAAKIFNEQLYKKDTVSNVLSDFAREFDDANELKESFLLGMISVAYADGKFDKNEYTLLVEAARILDMDEATLARIAAVTGVYISFDSRDDPFDEEKKNKHTQYSSEREHHLKILGLDKDATLSEIKIAYRILVKKYHPDLLSGQGMPESEIEKANQILKKINQAYKELLG